MIPDVQSDCSQVSKSQFSWCQVDRRPSAHGQDTGLSGTVPPHPPFIQGTNTKPGQDSEKWNAPGVRRDKKFLAFVEQGVLLFESSGCLTCAGYCKLCPQVQSNSQKAREQKKSRLELFIVQRYLDSLKELHGNNRRTDVHLKRCGRSKGPPTGV